LPAAAPSACFFFPARVARAGASPADGLRGRECGLVWVLFFPARLARAFSGDWGFGLGGGAPGQRRSPQPARPGGDGAGWRNAWACRRFAGCGGGRAAGGPPMEPAGVFVFAGSAGGPPRATGRADHVPGLWLARLKN